MGMLVGDIICPRYAPWVLLAAEAAGTLTGTPVETDRQFISFELTLFSQSSRQAFPLVLHVCHEPMHSALAAQRIMHSLLPDASCRNRRGALLLPLSAARYPHWDMYSRALKRSCHDPLPSHDHCITVVPMQPTRSDSTPPSNFM
jgi:hypothetical protein